MQLAQIASNLADRYRVERELGAGGMANVYLARDLKHDRNVAIKVLKPEIGAAVGAERFLLEIRTTANLRHPNIVPLYDSGEISAGETGEQALYYVMPLVEGESLRDRLARETQLPAEEALRITREVADALAYAHSRGVFHRDVKPENILLEGGHAMIADFGIARAVHGSGDERLTQTGMSLGTPMYMSPEQAAGGDDVDARSDQYSLSCVCYEMLAGQPPFTGPSALAITRQHMLADAPPVSNLRAGLRDETVSALQRALAKAPADRFPNIAEFSTALVGAANSPGDVAKRQPSGNAATLSRQWPRGVVIAAVFAALIGVALGSWKYLARPSTGTSNATSVAVLPFTDHGADSSGFLAEGVAETLINALARVPDLNVIARTSAFAFRNRANDFSAISRELHVANVLEGTIQRSGGVLRITAQLIRTADGFTIWSEKYDKPSADIFAVQDEVAKAVVAALEMKFASVKDSGRVDAGTSSPAAYDAYTLGRYHWNRRTSDGMIQAAAAFRKAIALDSNYARAWSGLADSYVLSIPEEYDVPGLNRDSALTWAEHAAQRAIALAPDLGEAHASLGEVLEYRNRYEDGGVEFRKAVELSPKYSTGHQWLAYHLNGGNQVVEGMREMEIAHRLDPLSHVITLSLAIGYDGLDQFAKASPYYTQGLAQSPEAWYAWSSKIGHDMALGQLEAALSDLRTLLHSQRVDSAKIAQYEQGLRTPATRSAAIDALVRDKVIFPALYFSRWMEGDETLLKRMARQVAVDPAPLRSIFVLGLLGPKLRADARVHAMGRQIGWPNSATQ